jgi:hypothetical protein
MSARKSTTSQAQSPEMQLAAFISKYSPQIAAQAKTIRAAMRKRYPTAMELVYDSHNALVIGYAPAERASDGIFSIALYPKWLSLFFLQAKGLPDPAHILKGSRSVARHVVLESPAAMNDPAIQALMREAVARARVPFSRDDKHRLIIKAIAPKQRPRRPQPA